jgi:hypothetical protein
MPMLAVGAITLANESILNGRDIDWRIPVATAFATAALALVEKPAPTLAVGVAWIALATVLLARVNPNVPAPVETLLKAWNQR